MSAKGIHFRQETPIPAHGHQKGQNSSAFHPRGGSDGVQLESAPGRAGKEGYVRVKKA